MQGFSLEHPWVLLLAVIFLLCAKFCKPRYESYYIPHLEYVLQSDFKLFNIEFFKWIGVFFLLVALSSPVYNKGYVKAADEGVDIVLTLDLSGSMRYPIQKDRSRFSALKEVVEDFIQKRENDRIGIVSFASYAAVTAPLSFDKKIVQDMFDKQYVGVVGEKTAIYDALFQTYMLFEDSQAKSKVIILFTDGINNHGTTPKPVIEKIIQEFDVKLYTIGLGSVDTQSLQEFAKLGQGEYFHAKDQQGLQQIYEQIDGYEKSSLQNGAKMLKEYYYPFALFLSLPAFFIYLYIKTQRGLQ